MSTNIVYAGIGLFVVGGLLIFAISMFKHRARRKTLERRLGATKHTRSMRTRSVRDPWMRYAGRKFDQVSDLTPEEKHIREKARKAGVWARGL